MADIGATQQDSTFDAAVAAFDSILTGETKKAKSPAGQSAGSGQPDDDDDVTGTGAEQEGAEDDNDQDSQEDDDDEAAKKDGDEDDDDDGEAKEEDEEGEGNEPRYKVKIDGQEAEVPLSELVAGYQRSADYTRKTQALAEQRKGLEAEAAQTKTAREQYAQGLGMLKTVIQQSLPPTPNWEELRQTDPLAFAAKWAEHQRATEKLQGIQAELQRVQQEEQQQQEAELARVLAEEADAVKRAIPEWQDRTRANAEKQALIEYGVSLGFSADELKGLIDHRAVVVLRNAWLYEQIRQRAAKTRKTGQETREAQVQTPPPRRKGPSVSEQTRLKQRLAKTGSVRDAAAVMERFV